MCLTRLFPEVNCSTATTCPRHAMERLTGWIDWYRFAREKLGYVHAEAVVYANVRTVEEENRRALRDRAA